MEKREEGDNIEEKELYLDAKNDTNDLTGSSV